MIWNNPHRKRKVIKIINEAILNAKLDILEIINESENEKFSILKMAILSHRNSIALEFYSKDETHIVFIHWSELDVSQ